MGQHDTVNLFGIPVEAMTMDQTLDLVDEVIQSRKSLQIGVINAAKVVNMDKDPELREAVLSSDIILADGAAVVWASKLLGTPLPERVAGIDLMFGMFERGNERGYRVFCLGATEEISKTVEENLARDYPGLTLAGRHHGYFTDDEAQEIADQVKASKADILLVAMTSPKKERFLAKWMAHMEVPVCHGVGGSFDVYAGKVERAPERWQKLGLEWLYRVKQEPGRLWKRYLFTNASFIWMLLKSLVGFKKAVA
ncbi:MAG: WecB/TagA/CpsF family glycosyltransferase [Candidatus Thiodiazotropha sp.]|jgi:N-acetylglucosaminyldiphosphoundecaprenol N-acetyl-beta-D-mannosaminyltransferase